MKSVIWGEQTAKAGRWFNASAPQLVTVAALLAALVIAVVLGLFGPYAWLIFIGAILVAFIIMLRQFELAAVVVLAVHLNVDWYLGLRVVSLALVLVLLFFCYIGRSPQYPWILPRSIWLWALFLGLTIIPSIRGATDLFDTLFYYPNLIFGALIMFCMGTIIARSPASIRLFFKLFSVYCALVALHTIIQSLTGVFLFNTTHNDSVYAQLANNHLPGMPDVSRASSFFIDPNWAGCFFAMTLFIPLGLFVESSSLFAKIVYLAEAACITVAMLFTYSTGSWLAASVSALAFFVLLGGVRYRAQLLLCLTAAGVILLLGFSSSFGLLLQHSSNPIELSSRFGAWQTALRVIGAFPITGVGLGEQTYLAGSLPFMVPAQLTPLAHPHNSYLEWGAMAGVLVLIVFVALLLFNIRLAFHNWAISDLKSRCLIAAGLAAVIALSINSFSINGWTFPALAAVGWLILGTMASPLLAGKPGIQEAVTRRPKSGWRSAE